MVEGIQELGGNLPQVDSEVGGSILKETTNDVIYKVVRNMKTGSAPGPDGLPTEFYKACCLELGDTLVRVVSEILATKKVPASFKTRAPGTPP